MDSYKPNVFWGRSRFGFARKYLKGKRILSVGHLGDRNAWSALIAEFGGEMVVGVDIEEVAVVSESGSGVVQVVGNGLALPFEDSKFSSVWLGEVIEHVYEPMRMLREVYRVLEPGGVLVLDTPNAYDSSAMWRYLRRGEDGLLGDKTHCVFYSFTSVRALVERAGFVKIGMASSGKLNLGFLKLQNLPGWAPWLQRFGAHLLVKAQKPGLRK